MAIKTYQSQFTGKQIDDTLAAVANKADKTYVDAELAKKADKTESKEGTQLYRHELKDHTGKIFYIISTEANQYTKSDDDFPGVNGDLNIINMYYLENPRSFSPCWLGYSGTTNITIYKHPYGYADSFIFDSENYTDTVTKL